MATVFLLVLFVGCITHGLGVRLSNFEFTGLKSYNENRPPFTSHPFNLGPDAVYVNESIFYSSYGDFRATVEKQFFVSVANLTDLTIEHRRTNSPHKQFRDYSTLFALNNRVYMPIYFSSDHTFDMTRLMLWTDGKWQPLNGTFPQVMARDLYRVRRIEYRPDVQQPNVVYVSIECVTTVGFRYSYHRLEVTDGRVRVDHLAGFNAEPGEVGVFTVWKNTLSAFVQQPGGKIVRYSMVINDQAFDAERRGGSANILVESVPGLVDGNGYQIDNFVVFTEGNRLKNDTAAGPERYQYASVLDLNTMEITETDVLFANEYGLTIVDEENNRIFRLSDQGTKVARLITEL